MNDCQFCKIIKGELEHFVYWEDTDAIAFLSRKPINVGHTLIIPKKHSDYIFDLDDESYSHLFQIAKKLSKPIQEFSGAKRIGVIVSGFQVPHVHVHVIPLNSDHDALNPNIVEITDVEGIEIAKKLKDIIS